MDSFSSICVVIVAYNRKNLLLECLEAVKKQSYLPRAIYIIDNASTDGTPELLKENGYVQEIPIAQTEPVESVNTIHVLLGAGGQSVVEVRYVRLNMNGGGAGGFYEGIKTRVQ